MNAPKKRGRPAKEIGGGSLPLATASSPSVAVSSATPTSGGHPRNAPGEWEITTLGRCVQFLSGGTPSKAQPEYWRGDIPWLSAKDMKSLYIDDTQDHISLMGQQNGTRLVPAGTTFLLTRGMTLLSDIPICITKRDMCFNQDVKAVIPREGICAEYIPYLLLANKQRLLTSVDLAGHGTGRLTADALNSLEVFLPNDDEQHKLAHILGTLDDKIALNRRINQTLEAMAQALFQSWFVDFDPVKAKQQALDAGGTAQAAELAAMQVISGKSPAQLKAFQKQQPEPYAELERTAKLFPSKLVESELGVIPEGWENSSIYEICDVIYGAPFKSSLFNDEARGLPLIRIRDLSHERPGVSTDEINSKGYQVQNGDLLVGMDGEFKPYIWGGGAAWMNQRICCFKPKHGLSSGIVKNFISRRLDYLEKTATATTVIHLGKGDIDAFTYLRPNDSLLRIMSYQLESIYQIVVNTKSQSFALTESRDSLLPKLLSGEISVDNIQEVLT